MIIVWSSELAYLGATRPLIFGGGGAGGAILIPKVEDGHINYTQIRAASRSGSGPQLQTLSAGGFVSGHVPEWDVNGNLVDSGLPPGSGGVNQIVAGTNISISPLGGTGVVTVTASGGSGSVTSVALTMPAEFVVTGSPITTAGTLAVTKANETANQVYAGPYSGSASAPTFRGLLLNDYPFHSESLTDGNSNFIFAVGDIVTVVGVPN